MELFKWYKTYSVNNEELNNHHKTLFNILNRLYENCIGTDIPNCLDPIVVELVSYSNYHFTTEELYMRNKGYKDIDKHILEHRTFTQRTLHLQQIVNKNDFELTKELIVFLGNWILHHVMEEDKKFSV
jgi:hemerythrin-like metal-binding protein